MSNSIWLPDWRMALSLASAVDALKAGAVKNASPFWYEVNDSGELTVKAGSDGLTIPDKGQLTTLRAHGAQITPTLTTTLTPEKFIARYSDKEARTRLAGRIKYEVTKFGYDGVDLDIEHIALTTDAEVARKVRAVYIELCRDIGFSLHCAEKKLSITVMARWSDDYEVWRDKLIPAVYDYQSLSAIADVFRIMAYDQHAPNTAPGPMAGYDWVKSICDYAASRVYAVKSVEIGIPLYGRDWSGDTVKSVLYKNVEDLKKQHPDIVAKYDKKEKEEHFTYRDEQGREHEVWYSNDRSVLDRLRLIQCYRFKGAAFWAASYESPTLWSAVAREGASRP